LKSPVSTYRVQINADFPFAAVRDLLEYFRDLGVGTLYFSPVFKARPRSPHGYDVTDPSRFSRDAGTEAEFAELSKAAAELGITMLLDIVPNHMAAAEDNPWWHDILEHGAATPSADFFDVDWNAPGTAHRIVLPILGQDLAACLQKSEIKLELRADAVRVVYFQRALPIDPRTYADVFTVVRQHAGGHVAQAAAELVGAALAIDKRDACAREQRAARKRATQSFYALLREKLAGITGLREAITTALQEISQPEHLNSFLEKQPFQLDFWRTGMQRINYRRFFDIADLAGVCIEHRDVFEVTHTLTLELILAGQIEGIRIDHVDGLHDPLAYLRRLRDAVGDTYVVVEKILAPGEELRADWPVQGTTGYDFIGFVTGLFVHPDGLAALSADYAARTQLPSFAEIVYDKKKLVIEKLFAGEVAGLAHAAAALTQRLHTPFSVEHIRAAIAEVSASLSVYRTYVREQIAPEDRYAIKCALTAARHRAPQIPEALFATLRRMLLLEEIPAELQRDCLDFIMSWQQFTGPVMAKGLEDTAFYTYHSLLSLSEVGSHPDAVTSTLTQFHELIARRAEHWPFSMNASSTHDTKRSEDVRARISVLSEMAPEWTAAFDRWSAINAGHKKTVSGMRVPHINEEILLYQSLLGAWPLAPEEQGGLSSRVQKYLLKAAREAKQYSSWLDPNESYEQALFAFSDAVIRDHRFLDDFIPFQQEVAYYGALNSLSQLILKLGAPGVPDIYQGNELWNLSLVDPDNRRPVDFKLRRELLHGIMSDAATTTSFARQLLRTWEDGRIKLYVTWSGLQLRRQNPGLFLRGEYVPVYAHGPQADHVVAFARRYEERWVLFAATRFYRHLAAPGELPIGTMWNDTRFDLPAGAPRAWQNILSNESAEGDSLESYFTTLPFGIFVGR
jgi:(1->4)-alpha-D-glucan 1-alpha-D-glucosylmutase